MNLNTLQDFRHEVYRCFNRAADALFNTVDALLTETQAHSFPELSLSPLFERRWWEAVPSWPRIAGTVVHPFCWPPRACPSINCCGSNASACCIVRLRPPRANAERRAKMASAFNAATPAPMGRLLAGGKAAMLRDDRSRSLGGPACICPKPGTSR